MSICQHCGGVGGSHYPACEANVPAAVRAQSELERLRAGIRALRAEVAPLTTVAAAWVDTRLDQLLVDDVPMRSAHHHLHQWVEVTTWEDVERQFVCSVSGCPKPAKSIPREAHSG